MNTKADQMLDALRAYLERMQTDQVSISASDPRYGELESSISKMVDLLSDVVALGCPPCPAGFDCVDGRCKMIPP